MGGSAFSAGPDALYTPRMPKPVYRETKARCLAVLRELYLVVASPIDGPGKADFGDIDILVAWPRTEQAEAQRGLDAMAAALGATRRIIENASMNSQHLAIPWPQETTPSPTAPQTPPPSSDTSPPKDKHIQLDVRICDSLPQLQWLLFKHAHGDIWNLLGTVIRPYGLTVDEAALWLRVPEIEAVNRKRARVFLTAEPGEVLQFLGLLPAAEGDGEENEGGSYWEEPFGTPEDLFAYVAQCRLFSAARADRREAQTGAAAAEEEKQAVAEEEKKALKSNDRRRMNYRPVFRQWIDDYLPRCREQSRFSPTTSATTTLTRQDITDEALTRFHVHREYTTRRDDFFRERQRETIWTLIKTTFPAPDDASCLPRDITYRSCLIKAMKRILLEGDASYGGIERPADVLGEDGFFVMENVVDFMVRRGGEVGEAAYSRQRDRFEESKKVKQAAAAAAAENGT